MKKKQSAKVRLNKTSQKEKYENWCKGQPNVCVIGRGVTSNACKNLEADIRLIFQPLTSVNAGTFATAKFKDITQALPAMGSTHLITFSEAEKGLNFRIGRFRDGPTLTFRVLTAATSKDVDAVRNVGHKLTKEFYTTSHPFLITSNFDFERDEEKIAHTVIQNMFPVFNIQDTDLKAFKRCVIFDVDKKTREIHLRHYLIQINPIAANSSISSMSSSKIPKMNQMTDPSELILQSADENVIEMPTSSNLTSSNTKHAIKLKEIGPRLKLELLKIEEDFFDGRVIYHKYVEKTPQEIQDSETSAKIRKEMKKRQKQLMDAAVAERESKRANKSKRLHPKYSTAAQKDFKSRQNEQKRSENSHKKFD